MPRRSRGETSGSAAPGALHEGVQRVVSAAQVGEGVGEQGGSGAIHLPLLGNPRECAAQVGQLVSRRNERRSHLGAVGWATNPQVGTPSARTPQAVAGPVEHASGQ